jgi:hypothetical protein
LIIGLIVVLSKGQRLPDEMATADFSPKTVHYRFLVRNTTNQPVADACLIVQAPLELTATQRCVRIESSHPYERIFDALGNPQLKFSFDTFAPYASKIVSVRASLLLAARPVAPAATSDPHGRVASLPPVYADDIDIRWLADSLKTANAYATAAAIYRWVADNIAYGGYSREGKGARHVLAGRQGDCTEFADLFVALARAVAIPARRVSGYLAHGNSVLKPAAGHDWAEFYVNGVWRIADAQQRIFDTRYADYIAMSICDPAPRSNAMGGFHRFYVHGKGLEAKMDS